MRFSRTVLLSAVVAAGLALSAGAASAAGQGIGASASGSGHFDYLGENRTFSFTAHTDAGGATSGQAQLNNRQQDRFAHIVIDCLYIVGNVATMSGTVRTSSDPNLVGAPGIFRVVDNGEGRNATGPDQISLVFFTPIACDALVGLPLNAVEQGNIQVR